MKLYIFDFDGTLGDSRGLIVRGKVDHLEGMKENVICGHLIPAGTGVRQFDKLIVGSKEEYERMQANKKNVLDFAQSASEEK